jgi:hypothetical protein
VFSFVPRCQGLCGSQKYTWTSVAGREGLVLGQCSSTPRVVPPLERSYSNNQYGNHRSLDLSVREGLNHA